jgi:hypothetical protein
MIDDIRRCGSLKTRNGKSCRILVLPCRHHDEGGPRKSKSGTLTPRRQILAARIAKGDSIKEAARKAGYKGTTLTSKVYSLAQSPHIKAQIRANIRAAHSLDTDEIVGSLVTDMRADIYDLLPDNEMVKSAHERGVSFMIKKIKQRVRRIPQGTGEEPIIEETTELEVYSRQEAARQLASILKMQGMQSPGIKAQVVFDEAIDTALEQLHSIGVMWTREKVVARVKELMVCPHPGDDDDMVITATDAKN